MGNSIFIAAHTSSMEVSMPMDFINTINSEAAMLPSPLVSKSANCKSCLVVLAKAES